MNECKRIVSSIQIVAHISFDFYGFWDMVHAFCRNERLFTSHFDVLQSYPNILVDSTSNCKFIFSVFFSQPYAKIDGVKSDFGSYVGIGISATHYIGMASMVSDADYTYDLTIFIVSVAIAIIVSFVAIYIFTSLQHLMKNRLQKMLTSVIIGLAVSSMHYTGLLGTTYYIHRDKIDSLHGVHQMNMSYFNIAVSIGMGLLLLLLLLSSFIDRCIVYRVNYFDSLTRLPNRRSFEKMLNSPSYDGSLAMWYIPDIEKINVEQGYVFGDKVIQHLGQFFLQWKPSSMKLYQLQGKRFVLSSPGCGRNR